MRFETHFRIMKTQTIEAAMSELVKAIREELPVDYTYTLETNMADSAGNVLLYIEIDIQFVYDVEIEELQYWAHKYRVSLEGDREETEFECFGKYHENSGPIRTVMVESIIAQWFDAETETFILSKDEFAAKLATVEQRRKVA